MSNPRAVVLFDGVCNFCDSTVQFIIQRDPRRRFQFASLQSEVGRTLAAEHGVDAERLDSVVLIEEGRAHLKSSAVLRIAQKLNWPWPMVAVFRIVPPFIRNWFYDWFAKRRYRWFGKKEACRIPTEAERERFLD